MIQLAPQAYTVQKRIPPALSRFEPVQNKAWIKPKGGLWTSEEFLGPEFWVYVLTPVPARVLVLENVKHVTWLFKNYCCKNPTLKWPEEFKDFARNDLDFVGLAKDYDAIHLTQEGQWKTRLSRPYNLYGWDCECTLWLHWKFAEVKDLGKRTYEKAMDFKPDALCLK